MIQFVGGDTHGIQNVAKGCARQLPRLDQSSYSAQYPRIIIRNGAAFMSVQPLANATQAARGAPLASISRELAEFAAGLAFDADPESQFPKSFSGGIVVITRARAPAGRAVVPGRPRRTGENVG
ncbi:MAG: hypothetical protein A2W68_02240 [Betaproteobacteria bacterium RIFCSPLOWO2_02_64_14]|nr:MAG: hypothetical protein A2W68_02240 [Betaproteobacteria bacterium RIFCSPLOWO2_02_64_14]